MDIAKSETFKYFTILNKALLFLIKVNKTTVQSEPKILQSRFGKIQHIERFNLKLQ